MVLWNMRTTSLTRRGLLGGAVALTALSACDSASDPGTSAPRPSLIGAPALDPKDWGSVRAQFGLDPAIAHFAAYVFASSPASVRDAITLHRAGFDHNPVEYLHTNESRYAVSIRMAAAGYLGVRTDEICFTNSTTMGLGLVYTGLRLQPGDEILTTEHDFYSTHESLRLRTERDGVNVRRVRLYADPATASTDEIVGNLVKAITPATRVIALTWVHSGTGVKLPVRQIADAVAGRALVCLDSVHGFGIEDAGPDQLGVDFLISGCHKWLFGPRGTGIVWGKPSAWARFTQVIPTFDFITNRAPGNSASPGGYHAYEYEWALTEAFAFHRAIGRDRIAARTHELNGRLKEGLAGMKGLRLVTPRAAELSAGIVCFDAGGKNPNTVVNTTLREAGISASVTPYTPPYVRLGASIATTDADVDKAIEACKKI